MNKKEVLKTYFGYDAFRQGQDEVTEALLNGQDVVAIMPTGAGKSLCFQIPAIMMEGITIVISPLISLMQDQVRSLNHKGIKAVFLNSMLLPSEYEQRLRKLQKGIYKVIYIAPERILTKQFLDVVRDMNVSLVAVDEAHCVSQWGHNFRPDYLRITKFIKKLKKRPVIGAFTATATQLVKEDIAKQLELKDPFSITTGFDRKNLYLAVLPTDNKDEMLRQLLFFRQDKTGIVYCSTRRCTEEVHAMLVKQGIKAVMYHGGMSDSARKEAQNAFLHDEAAVIVATSAFGMGIDKPDVSFVIHYQMPMSIEDYYQQAGRAGRNGERADCILIYNKKDYEIDKSLILRAFRTGTAEEKERALKTEMARLEAMKAYSEQKTCLRHTILSYFSEESDEHCWNCSCCCIRKVA